ncbi:hypothetical protein ACFPIJ_57430 [Dactylosporangium cerinum]|uniref:Uncharacterized protein n=1 Tax=Dactylosporangium cerinum TaxID=1434730 RepID=A0ABV9WK34_9ACTN
MRYLTRQFAIGALRRGHGIEQFLGCTQIGAVAAIQWVAISPMDGQYRVSLHTVQDPDDEVGDLPNLMSLDPVDEAYVGEGRELGSSPDEAEAIALAEQLTTTRSDCWVNHAVAGDEYMDFVRSRRNTADASRQQDQSRS